MTYEHLFDEYYTQYQIENQARTKGYRGTEKHGAPLAAMTTTVSAAMTGKSNGRGSFH